MNNFFVKQVMAVLHSNNTPFRRTGSLIQFDTPNHNTAVVDMRNHDLRIYGGGVTLRKHSHDNTDDLIATIQEMFNNPTHWKFN